MIVFPANSLPDRAFYRQETLLPGERERTPTQHKTSLGFDNLLVKAALTMGVVASIYLALRVNYRDVCENAGLAALGISLGAVALTLLARYGDKLIPGVSVAEILSSLKVNEGKNADKQVIKVQVNVSLSETVMHEANEEDTVFIYAKAINGPPIPIAIVRKQVSDLPLQVALDDSMAMMPNNKLSDHEYVNLIARISKSGNAIPESGDIIGTVNSVQTSTTDIINLTISQKVP